MSLSEPVTEKPDIVTLGPKVVVPGDKDKQDGEKPTENQDDKDVGKVAAIVIGIIIALAIIAAVVSHAILFTCFH